MTKEIANKKMNKAHYFAIKRFAIHDGEGVRTASIFRVVLCVVCGAIIQKAFVINRS
jgi:hypothetical protein